MLHALARAVARGWEADRLPVGEIARELYRRRGGSVDNQPDGPVGRRLDFESCSDVGAPPAVAVGRRSTGERWVADGPWSEQRRPQAQSSAQVSPSDARSEEHTSELQSRLHLVCRLLLEKNNRLAAFGIHHHPPKLT